MQEREVNIVQKISLAGALQKDKRDKYSINNEVARFVLPSSKALINDLYTQDGPPML